MRGLALFVAGTLVGLAATSMAQNQGPNRGVVGINHVALAVPDIDKAVEYYTKVMGFPEAFRVRPPQGEVQLVYIQVSKDTFIELQTINAQRPAGIYHFGVVVEDMAQATAMWKARGADVSEITLSSGTKAILSNIYDPNGVRMELLSTAAGLAARPGDEPLEVIFEKEAHVGSAHWGVPAAHTRILWSTLRVRGGGQPHPYGRLAVQFDRRFETALKQIAPTVPVSRSD
jgi:catechol 2,3-dioxygenase-like lactoylglutathione lyase family enzyme